MTPVKYYSSSLLNDTPFLVSSSPSHYVKQKRDFFKLFILFCSPLFCHTSTCQSGWCQCWHVIVFPCSHSWRNMTNVTQQTTNCICIWKYISGSQNSKNANKVQTESDIYMFWSLLGDKVSRTLNLHLRGSDLDQD